METPANLEKRIKQLEQKVHFLNQAVKQSAVIRKKFNSSTKLLKEKEKELKELNESLELRIKEEVAANLKKTEILNHQSKMAAMGEMLGNIAHQWRQPLSVISTAASGLLIAKECELLTDEMFEEHLNGIVKSTKFLSDTINDFRTFFQPNKEKKTFIVSEPIGKALSLLEASFKNNKIRSICHIDGTLSAHGFENEFIQATINIINNAKDAIKLNVPDDEQRLIFLDIYKEENWVIVKIKDNGKGIPIDILDKVFEPYFTTKHQSQGTGIGLYMTREIIVKHFKGKIKAENETYMYKDIEYTGAVFTVKIPLEE